MRLSSNCQPTTSECRNGDRYPEYLISTMRLIRRRLRTIFIHIQIDIDGVSVLLNQTQLIQSKRWLVTHLKLNGKHSNILKTIWMKWTMWMMWMRMGLEPFIPNIRISKIQEWIGAMAMAARLKGWMRHKKRQMKRIIFKMNVKRQVEAISVT